ncbi:hypothetical protein [Streptomyces sp. NPDC001381]|uniref:hypothetical protein n=1 Tax=Streptomyces sp. NPDC001381 TaxID=3364567 RepID=UPI0036762F72
MHTKAAVHAGETPRRLGVPAAWRTDLITPQERAALAQAGDHLPSRPRRPGHRVRHDPGGRHRGADLGGDLGGGHRQSLRPALRVSGHPVR